MKETQAPKGGVRAPSHRARRKQAVEQVVYFSELQELAPEREKAIFDALLRLGKEKSLRGKKISWEELEQRAPELADTFAANESEYRTELEKLDASFREVAGNGTRRTVVFGDRFPLLYFVKEYGLDYYAAFPGCSSAVEASPAAVAFLIGKVREENIPAVFHIELSKTEICEAIAEETGAKVLQFNACHNLTAEQFAAGATYISLMTENVSALAAALG